MMTALVESSDSSRIVLTLMWYGPSRGVLSGRLRALALEVTEVRDGSVAICLGREEISQANAAQRQGAFEEANSRLLAVAHLAGIKPSDSTDFSSTLWLTLDQVDSSVGIVLTPTTVEGWSKRGVEIFISVMRQD